MTSLTISSTAAVDITVEAGNKMDCQPGSEALTVEVEALEPKVV
ncbi:hypothetical protein [Pseudomonas thivervalensis]|nr:hypothetical protein [Pseudomonas thivervalensis]